MSGPKSHISTNKELPCFLPAPYLPVLFSHSSTTPWHKPSHSFSITEFIPGITLMEERTDGVPVEGYDLSKQYDLDLQVPDGRTVLFSLWLAKDEGQDYTPYVSVGYYGTYDEDATVALGFLINMLSMGCLGTDESTREKLTNFAFDFYPSLTTTWLTQKDAFGSMTAVISGQFEENNVNLLFDIAQFGTPGEGSWETVCDFE